MPAKRSIKEYEASDFQRWIVDAESGFGDVKTEYQDARKYFENVQSPSNVPANKEYVQENLITDLINGLCGQLVGGKVGINIGGGGPMAIPVKELIGDIMDRNMFSEKHLEPIGNMFYCEGMAGIYVMYDPYRVSPYGIGMPVIYTMRPNGEFLLDPSSKGMMHEDDIYRIHYKRVLVEYAGKKFKHLKGKIRPTYNNTKSSEQFCDLYTIEFKITDVKKLGSMPQNIQRKLRKYYESNTEIEYDTFYNTVMINKDQQAEEPKLTGHNRFRMIPVIHTPRYQDKTLPMGAAVLMKGKQDQINVVGSVALEAVKSDIKNLLIIAGANVDIEAKVKQEAAKTNGVIVLPSPDARVTQSQREGISTAILQWYEWQRKSFDEVSGRYAPERGATDIGLSGRAIGMLQARGTIPELTKRLHLEYAFTEMAYVILECIGNKMSKMPFKITRNIENEKKNIYFNTKRSETGKQFDESEYSVFNENVINDLTKIDVDDIDISVTVNMDVIGKEAEEANKALVTYQSKLIARTDAIKKLYKDEWREIIENLEKEDMAMKIVMQLMRLGPENLGKVSKYATDLESMLNMTDQVQAGGRGNGKNIPKDQQDSENLVAENTNPAGGTINPAFMPS